MARTTKSKTTPKDTALSESLDFAGESSQSAINQPSLSFEEALNKLEMIVKELEAGELSLDSSLEKFATGISLSKICLNKLNSAQEKMDKILQEENAELILKPFQIQEGGAE